MEKEKRIPFFKRLIISIKDIDKYNILISEKLIRAIIYLLVLMLIFSIILSACMTYNTGKIIEKATEYVKNETPNFKVSGNNLEIEGDEPLIIDNLSSINLKIILDDKEESLEGYKETLKDYTGNTVLALKNNLILITGGREFSIEYSKIKEDYKIEEITKDNIISLIKDNTGKIYSNIFISIFGVIYCIYTISAFIDALALSLLALIISKMSKLYITYTQDINISISALTLPIILNLIYSSANILTGFTMPYFQVMYTIISYIYIISAILIMKSELRQKKQMIKAEIEIRDLEKKQMEEKKQEEKRNEDEKEDNNKEEQKKRKEPKEENEGTLNKVKDKVKGKLNDKKEGPEPQANIDSLK